MITLVPTPIGNLADITLRALEVLKSVDGIICEDSRRTSILLNHYQIKKPLLVLNDFNEAKLLSFGNEKSEFPKILQKLIQGQNLALVSDAGTPLISDPGFKLVRECLKSGILVDSLPGPSAALTALTLSGLPPDKFLFLGYPPEKNGKRVELLKKLLENNLLVTNIFYVSPYKLATLLDEMKEILGDIEVVLTSELTKIHQSVVKDKLSTHLSNLESHPPKGEYTLVFNLKPSS